MTADPSAHTAKVDWTPDDAAVFHERRSGVGADDSSAGLLGVLRNPVVLAVPPPPMAIRPAGQVAVSPLLVTRIASPTAPGLAATRAGTVLVVDVAAAVVGVAASPTPGGEVSQ